MYIDRGSQECRKIWFAGSSGYEPGFLGTYYAFQYTKSLSLLQPQFVICLPMFTW